MLYTMVKTDSGWEKGAEIKALNGTPSCIGVRFGKGKDDIVALEVGSEFDLEDSKVKTFVNKGLCSRGFSSHYYKHEHTTTLSCGDAGVVLKLVHTPKMYGVSKGRGGATLKRTV